MKVLLCGSEGSLAQWMLPKLLVKHEVRGVDSLVRYGERPPTASEYKYEFVRGDLADYNVCLEVTKGVDVVLQAAARIWGVAGFNEYCADILGDNVTLHNNILKACAANGVKHVVYLSSSMVYESCVQSLDHPLTEDMTEDCGVQKTDYGLSKYIGERLCQAFHKQYGITYTIWRPFNILTPLEVVKAQKQGFGHVFADFINRIVVQRLTEVPIIGDGSQVRCFTWIDDVATAIAEFSFDERAKNGIFNLGNEEPITMRELAFMIHDSAIDMGLMPDNGPITLKTAVEYKHDVKVRVPSSAKAKAVFGWEPTMRVRDSIRSCLERYRQA